MTNRGCRMYLPTGCADRAEVLRIVRGLRDWLSYWSPDWRPHVTLRRDSDVQATGWDVVLRTVDGLSDVEEEQQRGEAQAYIAGYSVVVLGRHHALVGRAALNETINRLRRALGNVLEEQEEDTCGD